MPKLPAPLADEARHKRDALDAAAGNAGVSLAIPAPLSGEIDTVLACSDFIARAGQRYPQVLAELLHSGDLLRVYPAGSYREMLQPRLPAAGEDSLDQVEGRLGALLRDLRRREMIRIAWRDLAGRADLDETMADLSALADTCVAAAADVLYDGLCRRLGTPTGSEGLPQRLVIVAMGKLGARELNFSSDVDLIFAFPEYGHTRGAQAVLSNGDFFSRLCRRLVRVLGQVTAEGFVFRVDTNLRPFGESGPLVMSFAALESYYQSQGREWERYAWIKARVVAGEARAGRELMAMLRPFVYRRYLDYGVFESLREMKHKIANEVKRRGIEKNIKLGAGGIREVEFFGQIFQLIRGGIEPELQERRILKVLDLLVRQGSLQPPIGAALHEAYIFLRRVEHRLQAYQDQQTHDIPEGQADRLRLAWAMGFAQPVAFMTALEKHRRRVHEQFASLLEPATDPLSPSTAAPSEPFSHLWQASLETDQAQALLADNGFSDPRGVLTRLRFLRRQVEKSKFSREGLQRLDRLVPLFLKETSSATDPDLTLSRIVDILANIGRRTTYLALLGENPTVLQHLVRLVGASHFIATFLARHPVLLDELLDPRTLFNPPDRRALETDLDRTLAKVPPDEIEFLIESLCIFQQVNTLRVAAADVSGVLPLMKVSDHLSDLAEVILEAVVRSVWQTLAAKHGPPTGVGGDTAVASGFAIVAYGKLGGLELGYGSDLDLVFLHAAAPGQTRGGPHPIDNTQFFARLGQRVIHMLTSHTRAGRIYETDMRLRPSGSSGPLVSHINAFERYQHEDAWTWEHQALIRARAICGDPALRQRFDQIRRDVLVRRRDRQGLKRQVGDMRRRLMRESPQQPEPTLFDLKQGQGGIVDIEFIVQYLVLAYACRHPGLTQWTDNVRLLVTLIDSGLIDHLTAYRLREAYLTFRAAVHRLSLQNLPPVVAATRLQSKRDLVIRAWEQYLG